MMECMSAKSIQIIRLTIRCISRSQVVKTLKKTLNRTNRYVPDPSKSAQADSPHYDVVERAPASGFEQTHSVIKKHHEGLEKEGDILLKLVQYFSIPVSGFSMFLHKDGCICPKPQFAKHNKGPKQQKAGTDSMCPFLYQCLP